MKTCAICNHPHRAEIDRLLVEKISLRDIAGQTGTTRSALHRHTQHIPGALVAAKEACKVADAGTLLDRVQGLTAQAISILDAAKADGKHQTALAAIREVRGCLELLGKVNGELRTSASAIAVANAAQRPGVSLQDLTDEEIMGVIVRGRVPASARYLTDGQISALIVSGLTDDQLEAIIALGKSEGEITSIPAGAERKAED